MVLWFSIQRGKAVSVKAGVKHTSSPGRLNRAVVASVLVAPVKAGVKHTSPGRFNRAIVASLLVTFVGQIEINLKTYHLI